jgi:hypothetical protein
MRGPMHAMAVVAGFSLLSIIIPPLSYLSSAGVALVTLRQGWKSGIVLVVGASAIVGVLTFFISSRIAITPTLASVVVLTLLIWILAGVLRYTRSLSMTVTVAGAIGLVVVLALHLALGDPQSWWEETLYRFMPELKNAPLSQQQEINEAIGSWSSFLTGFLAAALVVNSLVCLYIGRWWQAILYNPGGFRREFHDLRLGKQLAIGTMIIGFLAFVPLGGVSAVAKDLLMVLLTLYVFQGLAVAHAIVGLKNLSKGWLVGVYVLVVLVAQLVAITGFIDTWVDFRQRIKSSTGMD